MGATLFMRVPRHHSAILVSREPEYDLRIAQPGRRTHIRLPQPGPALIRLFDFEQVLKGDAGGRKFCPFGTVSGRSEARRYGAGRIAIVGSLDERADATRRLDAALSQECAGAAPQEGVIRVDEAGSAQLRAKPPGGRIVNRFRCEQ